jgi:Uncharacterized conserved protein
MIKPLEEVLACKNDYLVKRFCIVQPHLNLSEEEGQQIFEDLLRFLWLKATVDELREQDPEAPDISISASMIVIDQCWHEFILMTEMYTTFCEQYFGRYIHHPPPMDKYARNSKEHSEEECMTIFLNEMIQAVIHFFGEAVAIRWFDEYLKYETIHPAKDMVSHHH